MLPSAAPDRLAETAEIAKRIAAARAEIRRDGSVPGAYRNLHVDATRRCAYPASFPFMAATCQCWKCVAPRSERIA